MALDIHLKGKTVVILCAMESYAGYIADAFIKSGAKVIMQDGGWHPASATLEVKAIKAAQPDAVVSYYPHLLKRDETHQATVDMAAAMKKAEIPFAVMDDYSKACSIGALKKHGAKCLGRDDVDQTVAVIADLIRSKAMPSANVGG